MELYRQTVTKRTVHAVRAGGVDVVGAHIVRPAVSRRTGVIAGGNDRAAGSPPLRRGHRRAEGLGGALGVRRYDRTLRPLLPIASGGRPMAAPTAGRLPALHH